MKIDDLKKILSSTSRLQLNWSREVGYVFVAPDPEREGEYKIVVPDAWPKNLDINLSYSWAVNVAQSENNYNLLCGTPLEVYSFSISRLMAEMENLILNVTSFVQAHEGLSQKEYSDVVNSNISYHSIM